MEEEHIATHSIVPCNAGAIRRRYSGYLRTRSRVADSVQAMVIPAFEDLSKEFNVSLNKTAYLV